MIFSFYFLLYDVLLCCCTRSNLVRAKNYDQKTLLMFAIHTFTSLTFRSRLLLWNLLLKILEFLLKPFPDLVSVCQ